MDLPLLTLEVGTQLQIGKCSPTMGAPTFHLWHHVSPFAIYGNYSFVNITFSTRPEEAIFEMTLYYVYDNQDSSVKVIQGVL